MAQAIGIDGHGDEAIAVAVGSGGRRRVILSDLKRIPRQAVIAAAMSARTAVTVWVTAPFNNRRKALRIVPTLLDVELPFPLEACVWSVVTERAGPDGRGVLAVAARQTDVRKRLDELALIGVDPHVLDHEGLALWSQSLEACPPGSDERWRAVCYLHAAGAVLALGEGGELSGVYTVPSAGRDQIERLLAARFGLDWRERSDPVGSLTFFVCGPAVAGQEALRKELDTPASVRWLVPDEPESFLALALAVRAARAGGRLACNLRRGELAHPGTRLRDRRKLCVALTVLIVAGLVAGAAGVSGRRAARGRLHALNRTFANEATRLAGYPVQSRGRDAVNEVSAAVADRLAVKPVFNQQLQPSLLATLQQVLQGVDSGGGTVERMDLELTGEVKLALRVADMEVLDRMLERWAAGGLRAETAPVTRAVAEGLAVELVLMRRGS